MYHPSKYALILVAGLAGCAVEPEAPQRAAVTPPSTGVDVSAAKGAEANPVTPPVVPRVAKPAATPIAETTELPPSVFEDATAVAAPVPSAPTIQTVTVEPPSAAEPVPSYVVASLTDPSVLAQPSASPERQILPQAAPPPSVAAPRIATPSRMAFLEKFEQSGSAPEGEYGYILIDANSGETLSERNADAPMPPASIAKLLATIAILDTRGPGGSFRTSLLADGPVSGGVLKGDLHMVGGGDPSLNRTDLSGLARRLAAAGVRQVDGRFYYHGDALPEVASIDRGQIAGAIYNPGISGLNLDRNERRGTSPVTDPARYTAEGMRRAAQSAGVTLPVPTKGQGNASGNEIAAHDSAPVSAILTEMFDISRNMTAEVLGAVAASEISGKPRSLLEAAQINSRWAQSQIGSIGGSEWSGFDFANNSGLSARSRATPRQMAALFRHGYTRHGETFKRIHEQQSQGSSGGVDYAIRTKIGTMRYVRGLGGIITLDGRDMIFAIMATDPGRSAGNAKVWMDKARRLEQALFSDWLQNLWPNQQVASR